jgi:cell division protein FtsW (lipid II flippase)
MTKTKKLWLGIFTFLPSIFLIGYIISFFSVFMEFGSNQPNSETPFEVLPNFAIIISFLLLAIVLGMAIMIYYIIHAAKNKAFTENNRLIWILVLIFASGVGSIVYYFVNIYPLPVDDSNEEVSINLNG